jgi:hypothetical protein
VANKNEIYLKSLFFSQGKVTLIWRFSRRCKVRFKRFLMAGLLAFGVAGVGLAKEPAQSKAPKEQQFKAFDFDKDRDKIEEVTGEVLKPDQSVTGVVGRRGKDTLIHIRTDFRDEILKSVEDL